MRGLVHGLRGDRPRRVLLLGSGPLKIGQAGEFDYSGSQALKALREDGVFTVLINPNIATVQTTEELADRVYFLPITPQFVEMVIAKEGVDAILLSFGGQTALNCGLELEASGILARYGVRVLGTPVASIRAGEDRKVFAQKMAEIGVKTARSIAANTPDEAIAAARSIGLPVILRGGFSLGGQGSSIIRREEDLRPRVERAFVGNPQVLVEECLSGWKEIEYEVVRDGADNCVTVCNMENVDPMGIHTGESIVVAPSQTLSDADYQLLRNISIRIVRHLGIVGECNVQYALDPRSSEYRVIEMNPRLSRSSALASKATGYPLAYVAAKIALGYDLPMLSNAVTKSTTAFFEPALDYIVCKAPRWDFEKFEGADRRIGTEMKSVGEVMAIGRSFGEVIQKALRMLETGADGLDPDAYQFPDLEQELREPSPRRIFAVARAIATGMTVERAHELTAIDPFFLREIEQIVRLRADLTTRRGTEALGREEMLAAKRAGFSDRAIARCVGVSEAEVRSRRHSLDVRPRLAQIDTLAAEYPADTNYLYWTYWALDHDVPTSSRRKVLVLGSGCYRIGSSVEFDWCSVGAVAAARELGFETIMLNCNPETVSTDYDMCDRLVFDEISLESVLELCDAEHPEGTIVSMGGQTPNNLALRLHEAGVAILGTPASSIDRAEDRRKFSALCDDLGIDQPLWFEAASDDALAKSVEAVGGFPVVVRPSYVLSGAAMRVAHGAAELSQYLRTATTLSPEHPVVISKFESHAREMEFDAVARDGQIVLWCVAEHVEYAGVHSGDATLVLPPQELNVETIRRARLIGAKLAEALRVTGPFNVQLLCRDNDVKVIECNLRASRSLPFVSKVLGRDFIRAATRIMLGEDPGVSMDAGTLFDLGFVAVKAPQFSFGRLSGADPVLGIEMASTGEVACMGDDADEALLKAMLATGFRAPRSGVLLSLGPMGDKYRFAEDARALLRLGLALFATAGTAEVLRAEGIDCRVAGKSGTEDGVDGPDALELMRSKQVDLVINIPREFDERGRPDGYRIRRAAIDMNVSLVTDLCVARKLVRALTRKWVQDLYPRSLGEYRARSTRES
jgi:carbamoyl-phosphate synthase large subunit